MSYVFGRAGAFIMMFLMWICNGALRYYRAKQQTQTSGIKYQVLKIGRSPLLTLISFCFLGSGNGKSSIRRQDDHNSISIVSCYAAAIF